MPRLSIPIPSHRRSTRRPSPTPLITVTTPNESAALTDTRSGPVSATRTPSEPFDTTIYPSTCSKQFTVVDPWSINATLHKSFGSKRTYPEQDDPLGARDQELASTGPLSPENPPSPEDNEDDDYMWPEYYSPHVWDDPADSLEMDDIKLFDGTYDRDGDVIMGGVE